MVILGVSDSHEAHACVMVNGEIVSAVAEERFSRLKADQGYPKIAIEKALDIAGVRSCEVDHVAFASQKYTPFHALLKVGANFSVADWISQCHEYWKPILLEGKKITAFEEFKRAAQFKGEKINADPYYEYVREVDPNIQGIDYELFNKIRSNAVASHLNLETKKISFYRHEDCHKYYGIYSTPFEIKDAVVLTLEGGGDDSSATYSDFRNGKIMEKWSSNSVNIGRLYRYVTLILGMMPSQHEYKVMGLAPYGSKYNGKFSLEFFNTMNKVNGVEILSTGIVKDLYFSVKDALEGQRFDGIAWGLQEHLQIILEEWVRNCVQSSGLRNVILSGGVGQNIKACKHVVDNVDLDCFWAGPICGDGSLGLGAAYNASHLLEKENKTKNLSSIYLGSFYTDQDVEDSINLANIGTKAIVKFGPTEELLADMLAKGKVCARFSGRMEFGQRALGNRSILANPCLVDTVEKINQKVKFRDFWMPFTPSMTNEYAESILINRKSIFSPYMTIAFDLVQDESSRIPAVVHPADKTARPQMVTEKDNPQYYNLLKKVGTLTGFECVLNTSFNLHGEAIVETPAQAIETFFNSGLDVLCFDNFALIKNKTS